MNTSSRGCKKRKSMVFSESTTTNMARKQNVFLNVATMCGAAKDILMFLDQNDLVH